MGKLTSGPAVDASGSTTGSAFVIVVNDHGQRALWQAELDRPAGWWRQSAVMPRRACLKAIAAVWPDIAPATVRAASPPGPHPAGPAHHARFVHELFAEQAARRPGAAAVIAAGTQLTYRGHERSANRLPHYPTDLGGGPGTPIGGHSERGGEAIPRPVPIIQ